MNLAEIERVLNELIDAVRDERASKHVGKIESDFYRRVVLAIKELNDEAKRLISSDIDKYLALKDRIKMFEDYFSSFYLIRYGKIMRLSLYEIEKEDEVGLSEMESSFLSDVHEILMAHIDILLSEEEFVEVDQFAVDKRKNQKNVLRDRFLIKFKYLQSRDKQFGVPDPDKEELWNRVLYSYENGFRCEYCGSELSIYEKSPYANVFSFDHKVPLIHGGKSDISNIAISCYRCNLVKGAATDDVWRNLVKSMPKDGLDKMFEQQHKAMIEGSKRKSMKSD